MKISGKVLIAFLASVGIFSAVQAAKYINTLSIKERGELGLAAKSSSGTVLLCEGAYDFTKTKKG